MNEENKKYVLTDEKKEIKDCGFIIVLHRIQAVRTFGNVQKGDLGGWIEKEENLSHEGNCWVADEACVYDDTQVYENAIVSGKVKVFDHAQVFGNARVYERACICADAQVCGDAQVHAQATVMGNVRSGDVTTDILPGSMLFSEWIKTQ